LVDQPQADGRNWEHPYFDNFNSAFNPQTTINRDNVRSLRLKWTCELTPGSFSKAGAGSKSLAPKRRSRVQTIPLVIDGKIFVADGNNVVYSIDAEAGSPRWSFGAPLEGDMEFGLLHTLNYHKGLVYIVSSNCVLYGLHPDSGAVGFQMSGIFPDGAKGYSGRTAPSFFHDTGITGAATPYEVTARGCVASCDLSSKEVRWRWFSVPPAVKGPKNWDKDASKGNIKAYPGDWGKTEFSGRGSVWTQPVVDEEAERVYFGTGDPDLFLLKGSLVPGPLLYTDCLVALNPNTGKMLWYYQSTPHDVVSWDFGWNTILAEAEVDGKKRKVAIGGTKGNHVYVLDAETGKPIYSPVRVGHNTTPLNVNLGNEADLLRSLEPGVYCPGHGGGINAGLAFAYNHIYVSSQRMEQRAEWHRGKYRGKPMKIMKLTNTDSPQHSTISAIDAGRGEIRWSFFIPNIHQSAGLVVSGGVLYAVDRKGVFYMLDALNGELIRMEQLDGAGSAGVSVAASKGGEMRVFVPLTGAEGSPNKLLCFGLS
jgi:alcohol dehydrogenase (cytochrome c)